MQPTPEEVNDKSGLACVRVSSLLRCRVNKKKKSTTTQDMSVCVFLHCGGVGFGYNQIMKKSMSNQYMSVCVSFLLE